MPDEIMEPCGDPQCDCHIPSPPPPVPADWHRDAEPRSRDELIAAHLNDAFARRWAERGYAALMLELIDAAFARCGTETYQDEFMAALLAVLAPTEPVAEEAPREHGYCTRPGCERPTPHAGPHKDQHNQPMCITEWRSRGSDERAVCVRAAGHKGEHAYSMWPKRPPIKF